MGHGPKWWESGLKLLGHNWVMAHKERVGPQLDYPLKKIMNLKPRFGYQLSAT